MRKQTHFRKVVSLALAAAMAVSVCTTALADDDVVVDAAAQPAASETVDTPDESAEEEKKPEVTDADVEQSEEQETAPVEENTPATQNGQTENGLAVQTTEGNETAEEVEALQKQINDALANADTATITLQENCTLSQSLKIPADKSVTLDLNGKTVTDNSEEGPWTEGVLTIKDSMGGAVYDLKGSNASINVKGANAKFILESGKITSLVSYAYGVYCSYGGTAIVNGGEIESDCAALTGNNQTGNMRFEVYGGTLTAHRGAAIYMPGQDTLKITAGTLNGGVAMRMGQVEISGGTINAPTDNIDDIKVEYATSGSVWLPHALHVLGGTYPNGDATYGNSLNIKITGGTFNSANGQGSAIAIYDLGKESQEMNIEISGDAKLQTNAADKAAYQVIHFEDIGISNPKSGYGEKINNVTSKLTGGTYSTKPDAAYIAEDYEAVQDGSVWKVQKMASVAKIGDKEYTSLQKAFADVTEGQTITLLKDVALNSCISDQTKPVSNVTLDLGGYTLSRQGAMAMDLYGSLTIKNGKVLVTKLPKASAAIFANKTASLVIEKDATIETKDNAAPSFDITMWSDCTNASVTVKGTLLGDNGLTVNGLILQGGNVKVNIDGATIAVDGHGIYQAGYADTIVAVNDSTISGTTGIEVRAGNLTVQNSKISGKGALTVAPNGNGTTTDGAGIAIAQHTTMQPINVTISGGEISGTYALYESNPQGNPAADIANVEISVTGGYLKGDVYSKDVKKFVNKGVYSTTVIDKDYIVTGYVCKELETAVNGCGYVIDDPEEVKTDVAAPTVEAGDLNQSNADVSGKTPGQVANEVKDAAANIAITDDTVTKVKQTVLEQATVTTDNNTETKLDSEAAKNKAVTELEDKGIDTGTDGDNVTIVAVPKLVIEPQKAVSNGDVKEISFDIKLLYDVKATTADDPSKMVEEGVNKNTVTISTESKKVENPPVMDITLDVSVIGFTKADEANLYVKHTKDADEGGAVYYYGKENGKIKDIQYATDNNTIESLTFINEHGFSEFAAVTDNRTVTINFDKPANTADASKTYVSGNVDDALPAAAARNGYRFIGWRINGEVYTTLYDSLLSTLNGSTVEAFAVYELIPTGTAASDSSSTSTSAPEATAAPSVGGNEVYYTCVACGHHDWTATAEGYKCNYCGHLESVKQLSGYANVKGTYEPKTSTAKAAAKSAVKSSSAIPQTSDDMPIVPIAVIAIAALLGLGVTVVLKRKHN